MDEFKSSPEAIIERIKRVFATDFPRRKLKTLKLTRSETGYEVRRIQETFAGKFWEEVIIDVSVIYLLTDVDSIYELTDKAYFYYLPAFLITTLNNIGQWEQYKIALERILGFDFRFSLEQIETLIAYFEFYAAFESDRNESFTQALEETQLHFMMRRDELQANAGKTKSP